MLPMKTLEAIKAIKKIDWSKSGIPLAFVVMMIGFTLINPAFLSVRNVSQTLRQGAILFLIVSGQTLALLTRGIDLSQGSVMSLVSIATISSIYILGTYLGSLIGIFFGGLCGFVNGILIGYLHIPPILATLGMLFIVLGVELVYSGGVTLTNLTVVDQAKLFWFGGGMIGPIPVPVIFALIIGFLLYYLLRYTKIGRYFYFIGANPDATRMIGVKMKEMHLIVYTFSALLASLGSFFLTARLSMGFPLLGEGWLVLSIGGAVIGGTSILGGEGGIWEALMGTLLIVFLDNGLIVSGLSVFAREAIIGCIIILACMVCVIRRSS
jgi:ribose/xylose/arabinose/galactoside ABC-type transport system permease subunit